VSPSSLPCPYCLVTLRIRDRKLIGRQVDCPDCNSPILVVADGPTQITLQKVEATPHDDPTNESQTKNGTQTARPLVGRREWGGQEIDTSPSDAASPSAEPTRWQRQLAVLMSPVGIFWSVAAVVSIALLSVVWTSGGPDSPITQVDFPGEADGKSVDSDRGASGSPDSTDAHGNDAVALDDSQSRLQRLGRRIVSFVDEHDRYPASPVTAARVPERERFGWMAELAVEFQNQAGWQPQWDQSWRDPLNDRFIRRSIPEFQNPTAGRLTSPDGYPASHFVGIAGVGRDGPGLAVDHPRAGMFGARRVTRVEDIQDGQANTMMVAGVTSGFGGWAASGSATMRPLTREPYVNGPDGFGTGQKEGMLVLMADGSVRFCSVQTDPRIFRRMAAIADGFPLDPNVPGEPGDAAGGSGLQPLPDENRAGKPGGPADPPKAKPDVKPPAPAVAERPKPIEWNFLPVEAPVPPKKIDVAALLSQKILKYEQTRAAPFRDVFRELEEMIGVPIRVDEQQLGAVVDVLDKPVSLKKMQKTTVGEILQALVKQAGLAFIIESDGIRIQPTSPGSDGPGS